MLISVSKKLDKLDAPAWQVGVQFSQVGNDEKATKHLQQLDDEFKSIANNSDIRNMVDTVPFSSGRGVVTADGILKVVLGAVHRRYDRKQIVDLHE